MGNAKRHAQNNKCNSRGLETNLDLAMYSRIWIRSNQFAKLSLKICYQFPICADEIVHIILLDLLQEPI